VVKGEGKRGETSRSKDRGVLLLTRDNHLQSTEEKKKEKGGRGGREWERRA